MTESEHGPRPVKVSGNDHLELSEEAFVAFDTYQCDNPECELPEHVAVHLVMRVRSGDPDHHGDGIVKEVRLVLTQLEAFRMGNDLVAAAQEQPFMVW